MKKDTYPISLLVKTSHQKFEDPKMTRRKLKILKLQNTKTKDLGSFQKKSKYPISPLTKLHTKKF
jgi:hypothetical protein